MRAFPVFALTILGLWVAGVHAAAEEPVFRPRQPGPDTFGHLFYEAENHLDLSEGTYEVWFRANFDPFRETRSRHYSPFNALTVRHKETGEFVMRLLYDFRYDEERGLRRNLTYYRPVGKEGRLSGLQVPSDEVGFEQGRWHHLAARWRWDKATGQCRRDLFVDGKRIGETVRALDGELPDMAEYRLTIGSERPGTRLFSQAFVTLDGIRISNAARSEEEIRESMRSGPREDASTLLLDRFDNVVEGVPIPASGGTIDGAYEVVETPLGRGVRMHAVDEE